MEYNITICTRRRKIEISRNDNLKIFFEEWRRDNFCGDVSFDRSGNNKYSCK